ncbi:Geranylgeranyl transferase type-1 subunit beta, partial [Kappamyces sp. JEL0680]
FAPFLSSDECDLRFLYCACAISFLLNDWSGIDLSKALVFIRKCQSYDGGFGLSPNLESHGASTYCALASLSLMGRLDVVDRDRAIHWLISRQSEGFHGRINKPDDTCYGYWIGGALD